MHHRLTVSPGSWIFWTPKKTWIVDFGGTSEQGRPNRSLQDFECSVTQHCLHCRCRDKSSFTEVTQTTL